MNTVSSSSIDDMIQRELGIQVRYVDDLPDGGFGFLDPSEPPTYIAVNRTCHPSEQVFTIFHELGHLFLHRRPRQQRAVERLLDHVWDNHTMAVICRATRRYAYRNFGPERQADMFAFGLLLSFRRQDDIRHCLNHHPDKSLLFAYTALFFTGQQMKRRGLQFFVPTKLTRQEKP